MIKGAFSKFSFKYDNWGANASGIPGTSVVPGASNVEGSWTQVASAANIAQDCYAFLLRVSDGFTSAAQKDHLLDIGVDQAGGTSYTAVISNIVCGASGGIGSESVGLEFAFPLCIKAGSSVAVRIQGSNATAGTVMVGIRFYGQPDHPENVPVSQYSETLGTITNSQGVSFTPGNAADGTWVSLGTTTLAMWWWQIGYQVSNSVITTERTYIEIAYGDATNKHLIMRLLHIGNTNEEITSTLNENLMPWACYCPVPAGTNIYIRGRCENAPDTGYNGVAIGIGG